MKGRRKDFYGKRNGEHVAPPGGTAGWKLSIFATYRSNIVQNIKTGFFLRDISGLVSSRTMGLQSLKTPFKSVGGFPKSICLVWGTFTPRQIFHLVLSQRQIFHLVSSKRSRRQFSTDFRNVWFQWKTVGRTVTRNRTVKMCRPLAKG
jgi:hypothetical protein